MRVGSVRCLVFVSAAVVFVIALFWFGGMTSPASGQQVCDANYSGGCVPIDTDVDCLGGSGDGPSYFAGPAQVVGTDIYGLDADNDGYACEPAGFVAPQSVVSGSVVAQSVVAQSVAPQPVAVTVAAAASAAAAVSGHTSCGADNCGFGSTLPGAGHEKHLAATATKSAPPTLALTGSSHVLMVGVGLILLGLGLIALHDGRRREQLG